MSELSLFEQLLRQHMQRMDALNDEAEKQVAATSDKLTKLLGDPYAFDSLREMERAEKEQEAEQA